MADEADFENEKEQTQFKEFFLNKLRTREIPGPEPKTVNQQVLTQSDGQKINVIVSDIMVRKKNGEQIKETMKEERPVVGDCEMKKYRRKAKWTQHSEQLFFKLFGMLGGDLDLIQQFFQKHTEYCYSKKQIKKKYNIQMKKDANKFKVVERYAVQRHDEQFNFQLNKLARQLSQQEQGADSQLLDRESIPLLKQSSQQSQSIEIKNKILSEANDLISKHRS